MCPSHCCFTQDRKKLATEKGSVLQSATIELNVNMKCEFKIPPGSVKKFALLGHYTANSGNSLPIFQDNQLIPSSR